MAPKRQLEDSENAPQSKKHRSGFKVGPENLPDGTWKRKVIKIKKDLIHKAKVKKSYAKLKAREGDLQTSTNKYLEQQSDEKTSPEPAQGIHPERQLMLDAADASELPEEDVPNSHGDSHRSKRPKKPGYFEKELAIAKKKKGEAEERKTRAEKKAQERNARMAKRVKQRKIMAKARSGGKNGQRKLGLESKVLLEKVQEMVAK
ncbi:hypothetical protein F5884DRAFT_428164 [Xylogone sp. PMI_703]|nr:hypothetical protein F5884DRAFT_428164 [Xylogone sp. PMI_703]